MLWCGVFGIGPTQLASVARAWGTASTLYSMMASTRLPPLLYLRSFRDSDKSSGTQTLNKGFLPSKSHESS